MEEISDSSLQPSSNQLRADVGLQLPCTFGPQTEFAASIKRRKSKATSQKPVCNQEKNAFPVRPLRRKDSLASHCKENSDGSVQCSTVPLPDGLFKQSPAAEISKEDVQPHLVKKEHAYFSEMAVTTPHCKPLQQGDYATQTSSVTKISESLQVDSSFSSTSPDLSSDVLGDLKPTSSCQIQLQVAQLQSVDKKPDREEIPYYQIVDVTLEKSKHNTGTQSHVDDFPEETLRSSSLPIPKPRTKKHPSGLFMEDDANHDVPAACLPSDKESSQQDGQLISPVPLPRGKKRLSASYSGSTQNECGSLIQQNETSLKNTTAVLTPTETTEDSLSQDLAVISGGCAQIQGGGDCLSEVEREVLAAMAEEELTYTDSQEEAKDELMEGWTFTDQCGVIEHFEQDEISALPNAGKVLDADIDKSFAVDDWLCIASDNVVELQSKNHVKCEEVDFGFVSIDVAAGSVQDER